MGTWEDRDYEYIRDATNKELVDHLGIASALVGHDASRYCLLELKGRLERAGWGRKRSVVDVGLLSDECLKRARNELTTTEEG